MNSFVAKIVLAIVLAGCATAQVQDPFLLLDKGMFDTAEKLFRDKVKADPHKVEYKNGLGAALAGLSRYQEACALLDKNSQPLSVSGCWLKAAQAASAARQWEIVLSYGKRVDISDWDNSDAEQFYTLSAEAARKKKDWDHLLVAYPVLLRQGGSNAKLHYLYAKALEQREYYEKAFNEYKKAIELDPDNSDVKRYMNRLQHKMDSSGSTAAARIESLEASTTLTTAVNKELNDVRMNAWEHGSVEAIIEIEAMDAVQEDDDITEQLISVPVEIITAHWPSTVKKDQVLGYISRLAMDMQCPAVGENGKITVTVGPAGTVRDVSTENIRVAVSDCLQREMKAWIFNNMQGGYLKFSVPFPLLDEADLYGDDFVP